MFWTTALTAAALLGGVFWESDFSPAAGKDAPKGWKIMRSGDKEKSKVAVETMDGKPALHLTDQGEKTSCLAERIFAVKPGKFYRITVEYRYPGDVGGAMVITRVAPYGKATTRLVRLTEKAGKVEIPVAVPAGSPGQLRVIPATGTKDACDVFVTRILIEEADQPYPDNLPAAAANPAAGSADSGKVWQKFYPVPKPDADGLYTLELTAPKPGVYNFRTDCSVAKIGKQHFAEVSFDGGPFLTRRVLGSTVYRIILRCERLRMTDRPVRIRIRMPKDVTLHRVGLMNAEHNRTPKEAFTYEPPAKPRAGHPRVLVTPEIVAALKKTKTHPENAGAWAEVVARAKQPLPELPTSPGYMEQLYGLWRCRAMYYLLTGDKKIAREAADSVLQYFTTADFGNAAHAARHIGGAIYAASLVYDWCYPVMTDKERRTLIDRFTFYAGVMECGWPPFLQPISVGHGNEAQMSRDLLSMAIAVYDEDPQPYRFLAWQVFKMLQPQRNYMYRSLKHDQGTAYGAGRHGYDLIAALQMRRSTGTEILDPRVAQVPFNWLYRRTPDGKLLTEGDDSENGYYPFRRPLLFLYSAALWPSEQYKFEMLRNLAKEGYVGSPVEFLLYNRTDLKAVDTLREQPTVKYFPAPLGDMVIRTGWNTGCASDDAVITLRGGGLLYWNHSHRDAGSFQIYCRGILASDLGQYSGYGTPYDWNFTKSSLSHSVMRFIDPKNPPRPGARRYPVLNTGGQNSQYQSGGPITLEDETERADQFRLGTNLAWGFGPDKVRPYHAFLQCDLTPGYAGRVRYCLRDLVFLNLQLPETQGALIVYDRYETLRPEILPVWQFTSWGKTERTARGLTVRNAPFGLPGSLHMTTLLPEKPDFNILTGPAAHTFGRITYTPPIPDGNSASGTRTELTNSTGEVLNVIQINNGEPKALPVKFARAGKRIGLEVADRMVWLPVGRERSSEPLEFTVSGGAKQLLVLGLAAGNWRIAGQGGAAVTAESGAFHAKLAPGQYRLEPGDFDRPVPAAGRAPEPPQKRDQVWLDGKLMPEKLVEGRVSLTFTGKAPKLELRDGADVCDFSGLELALAKPALHRNGKWYLDPADVAELLGLELFRDPATGSMVFRTLPERTFLRIRCPEAPEAENAFRSMTEKGSPFQVLGRNIVLDLVLTEPRELSEIAFKWQQGNARKESFKLEVSANGKSFDTVFNGSTSGKTADFEPVKFSRRKVRCIRISFRGNSVNPWNSLRGFRMR